MRLLHPWFLAGLLAVALPVVVHYLTRPRPRVLPLSTIRFVRQAVEQRRARHRLRDFLVLLLRTAAVLLIAWAFARPLIASSAPKPRAQGDTARVVILDQSQSMAAVSEGVASFERARAAAAAHLGFESGLSADLILAGAQPRAAFATPSTNFAALRETLASAKPTGEGLNVKASLDRAGEILSHNAGSRRRELWIFSDFQRSNWASADFSALPADTDIHLQPAAPATTPPNLAVLRAAVVGRAEQGRELRLEVDVGNYSPAPRDVKVEVSVGGGSYQLAGRCPPGSKTTLSTPAVLQKSGWQTGVAKLLDVSDALAADNVRPLVVHVRPPAVYALVTRDSSDPHASSSHFIERALVPHRSLDASTGERVVRMNPSSLDRESLAAADLIVLDHPGRLSQETANLIFRAMRLGRGVLYVASEDVDASNLGVLASAAGAELRLPVEFQPSTGRPRSDLFILATNSRHPLFGVFGDQLTAALAPIRFGGGLASRRIEGSVADDILATYNDQSACLVLTRCGQGMFTVLNADLGQSNLVASPLFVPLVEELAGRLIARASAEEIQSGQSLVRELPLDAGPASGLSVARTSSTEPAGTFADSDNGAVWRWPAVGPPGVYTVRRADIPVYAVASTISPDEADLAPIDLNLLKTRLAGGRTVQVEGAADLSPSRDIAWAWLAVACAACMLLEILVLKFFRT
jgi:hypothetical protein